MRVLEWIGRMAMSDGICPIKDMKGKVTPPMEAECELDEAIDAIGTISKAIVYHSAGKYKNLGAVCSYVTFMYN